MSLLRFDLKKKPTRSTDNDKIQDDNCPENQDNSDPTAKQ